MTDDSESDDALPTTPTRGEVESTTPTREQVEERELFDKLTMLGRPMIVTIYTNLVWACTSLLWAMGGILFPMSVIWPTIAPVDSLYGLSDRPTYKGILVCHCSRS